MDDREPFKNPASLSFSIYQPEEIKKLSVLEVHNSNPFDALDHPTSGGLHDPLLGSTNQQEPCESCGLTSTYCPGHVGHITLPLPVFNPALLKVIYQLLKGTCLSCNRLLATKGYILLSLYQFQALDYGLVGKVFELHEAFNNSEVDIGTGHGSDIVGAIERKLRSILQEALDHDHTEFASSVQSVVECRRKLIKEFIQHVISAHSKKCPHCSAHKKKLVLRHNSHFILLQGNKVTTPRAPVPRARRQEASNEDLSESTRDVGTVSLTALEAKQHLEKVWENDGNMLGHLFGILKNVRSTSSPMNIFFIEILVVPPSRFRPLSLVKGMKYLNPLSASLKNVLQDCQTLRNLMKVKSGQAITDDELSEVNKIKGQTDDDKLSTLWIQLQADINCIYSSDMDKLNKNKSPGVKQILEKKEGLLRKNMMGKRVDFAARSVIAPDPDIMVDEVGIPEVFAKRLTFPTPVTNWNENVLRTAVINGPDTYPGANFVELEDGKVIKLFANKPIERVSLASRLLTPPPEYKGQKKGVPKKVYRHLQNGDILLLNRQPTLHKPSIMAHRARVLPGIKCIRLHYANCKAYNADFDGDEMNAHFPQNEVARAEGYNIVTVNQQYLVPKDGTPLSGLIQDFIVAGTLLTMRGVFFTRSEYQLLVFTAMPFLKKRVKTLPPAIMKPQRLWSGKQVISTVIINLIPDGKPPPTIRSEAKVSSKHWQRYPPREWEAGGTPLVGDSMSESEVIISGGELLCGVVDKAQVGPTPYGLVHCCYELYSGEVSSNLLTSFGRLFTTYLECFHGFTVGIEDLLLTAKASKKRHKILRKTKKIGDKAAAAAFDVDEVHEKVLLIEKLKEAHLSSDNIALKTLDFEMKKFTEKANSDMNAACIPSGLVKKFPSNNFQMMVLSGAKGAQVNAMQISCALGQVELEGRRVPLMLSGNTLPTFLPYDTSPRAGGFVASTFLTGVPAPENYFHCMAGREGLVDTAVKTSRSGYLQRCLIKHLEGVVVNYDMTVRDSDGSIIQYLYGEDGLDVNKMQMLKEPQLHHLAENYGVIMNKGEVDYFKAHQVCDVKLKKKKSAVSKWKKKRANIPQSRVSGILEFQKVCPIAGETPQDRINHLIQSWTNTDIEDKKAYSGYAMRCPDPVNSQYSPDQVFGSVSEKMDQIIDSYISKNHSGTSFDETLNRRCAKVGLTTSHLKEMIYYRALRSLVEPGEPVGILAAQSVGEPSTQMTLNTFHFAGRGEMNVTLGIPRLREILMTASANIATPTMDLPLRNLKGIEKKAEKLKMRLSQVLLSQVLHYMEVEEQIHIKGAMNRYRCYNIKFQFLPPEVYKGILYTSPSKILKFIEDNFIQKFCFVVKRKLKILTSAKLVTMHEKNDQNVSEDAEAAPEPDDEGGTSDEGDGDAHMVKTRLQHNQELEYDDPESEEEEGKYSDVEPDLEEELCKTEPLSDEELENVDDPDAIYEAVMQFQKDKETRIKKVTGRNEWIVHYDYDHESELWCTFTLQLSLRGTKIDMKSLIENEVNKTVVYEVKNIKKAFLVKNPNPEGCYEKMLKTDGVNFLEVFLHSEIIDINKINSNDIHAVAKIYGIEAASRVIVKEIKSVFATYGIEVNPRHLLLIADYMTISGEFKACNRMGMENKASPLQQMTFETTMNFLNHALLTGSKDLLNSPSSRLVTGQTVKCGTGIFDLCFNFLFNSSSVKQREWKEENS